MLASFGLLAVLTVSPVLASLENPLPPTPEPSLMPTIPKNISGILCDNKAMANELLAFNAQSPESDSADQVLANARFAGIRCKAVALVVGSKDELPPPAEYLDYAGHFYTLRYLPALIGSAVFIHQEQ